MMSEVAEEPDGVNGKFRMHWGFRQPGPLRASATLRPTSFATPSSTTGGGDAQSHEADPHKLASPARVPRRVYNKSTREKAAARDHVVVRG